jgi:CBS domain containing-hemolysin-like protein
MRRLKVRDVMTPRVRMAALPHDATRDDVLQITAESRLTQIPVYEGDLDHIRGILHVKRYLLDESAAGVTGAAVLTEARFVPDVASLDQMLDHLRHTGVQSAIVVDEYGGTEGIVSIEDVVEELVGDIVAEEDAPIEPPRLIGLGCWHVQGDMSVHEWSDAFGIDLPRAKVSTLSGFIVELIGRAPEAGDVVEHGPVRIEVEAVERGRVLSALVMQRDDDSAEDEGAGAS